MRYPVSGAESATALVEMMRTTADPERVKQRGHSHHGRHATTSGLRPSSRYARASGATGVSRQFTL